MTEKLLCFNSLRDEYHTRNAAPALYNSWNLKKTLYIFMHICNPYSK
jgi:hypothetical protein